MLSALLGGGLCLPLDCALLCASADTAGRHPASACDSLCAFLSPFLGDENEADTRMVDAGSHLPHVTFALPAHLDQHHSKFPWPAEPQSPVASHGGPLRPGLFAARPTPGTSSCLAVRLFPPVTRVGCQTEAPVWSPLAQVLRGPGIRATCLPWPRSPHALSQSVPAGTSPVASSTPAVFFRPRAQVRHSGLFPTDPHS